MAFERANWWLRDPVSGTNFANVNNNGNCNYNNASNANVGVRPDFGSADKSSEIGIAFHRKERPSVPKGEKTALAKAEPHAPVCPMRQVTTSR